MTGDPGAQAVVCRALRKTFGATEAVAGLDLTIRRGEVFGLLGPNGAGKTTTLKMLSGLLHPTQGKAVVLGFTPWDRKADFLTSITMVMGQRNRLSWDIPAADSFLLNQAVYRLSDAQYRQTIKELDELLDLGQIMRKPVRNLSLGERMKCELAAGLLHRPQVLFLDEPTIGLDISAQARIRSFLLEYNRRYGATILLTSHYMADVAALCERVIIIDLGRIKYDGSLGELSRRFTPFKRIGVAFSRTTACDLSSYGTLAAEEESNGKQYIRVPADQATAITARLLAELPVHDLTIEDPSIEEVIQTALEQ